MCLSEGKYFNCQITSAIAIFFFTIKAVQNTQLSLSHCLDLRIITNSFSFRVEEYFTVNKKG